jgi:hypothetical protein
MSSVKNVLRRVLGSQGAPTTEADAQNDNQIPSQRNVVERAESANGMELDKHTSSKPASPKPILAA